MPTFTSVHIIFNPNSTGDAKSQAHDLKKYLAKSRPKLPVTLLPTDHAGHAVTLAYDTAKKVNHPLIISASGDGGYNEVINGALKAQAEGAHPVCAVLPSGNANDHARTQQDRPLAESIAAGAVTTIDVLQVTTKSPTQKAEQRYAHSYVGLGLTPAVAVELNKYSLNSLKESIIVLKTFWNLRPITVKRGTKTQRLDSLICSTIPEMAKFLTLSGEAKADDGRFEVTALPHGHKVLLAYRLLRGVFASMEATSRQSDYICRIVRAAPMQLDGEVIELKANTVLRVGIKPGLLRTVI